MNKELLRGAFLEVVENQLRENNPKETKEALGRLKSEGWSEHDAKMLIAQCVILEIFDTVKLNKEFNLERYKSNLVNLPNDPLE